jgi:predicted helicase
MIKERLMEISMEIHIEKYFQDVCEAFRLGNIETSFNKPIMALLACFGCIPRDMSGERSGAAGENIDIKLWREGDDVAAIEPFAGVEVKKVGGIDERATAQAKISAARFGNVILTDNLRWEFWRAGEEKMYAGVRLMELDGGKIRLREDNVELFISLVQDFMLRDPSQIRSSSKLAEYMAIHAKTIRSVIAGILKGDSEGQPLVDDRQRSLPMFPELYGLFRKIKEDLRPLLDTRGFADMYAQTIVYGLFIARYNDTTPENFNRLEAIDRLREESALLSQFFNHIATGRSSHPMLSKTIDKLCELYKICDISSLLDNDIRGDAIVHFYEDFLTHYDPELRKSLGVFYTPHQVVKYLIGMVDKLLIEEFGIEGGLSNNEYFDIEVDSEEFVERKRVKNTRKISVPRVAILDPACGTGTFHAEIIRYIKDTYFSGARSAFYEEWIGQENGLLSRMIGFEIMMTSYAVAHLKVHRTIKETLGHAPSERLPTSIYLTNTLSPPHTSLERNQQISLFDFSAAIADEAYNADTWKARRPIKVIAGNPPYRAASANPYDIEAYKTEADGISKLNETNTKLLADDYVKFFRFAEQIINKNEEGILAFVSNNGFLDNQSFRGMRASLLRTFDKIFIVDLHGSAAKSKVAADGIKDENIFDIMQGVSLFIGIKTTTKSDWAKVYHSDLLGLRESKFKNVQEGNISYTQINPDPKMAYFIPIGNGNRDIYENGVSVAELFLSHVNGIKSDNDRTAITSDKGELQRRLDIVKYAQDEKAVLGVFGKFNREQTWEKIQDDVLNPDGVIAPINYRPFDTRFTYYTGKVGGWLGWPKAAVMSHFLQAKESPIGKNIGLLFSRVAPKKTDFSMVFVTDKITDKCSLAVVEIASIAPLYLYDEISGWQPNLDPATLNDLTQNLTFAPTPVEIFDYCYGVLHDPAYRQKYNEFLKRDFPRVPIIESEEVFRAYASVGERLRKLHLMQTKVPATLTLEPNTAENLEIATPKYKDGILHLNKNKQIHGIPEEVWAYRIGGYQVIDKWLKSHKGKTLTIDDFDHIANIVGLLAETIRIQENLRTIYGEE